MIQTKRCLTWYAVLIIVYVGEFFFSAHLFFQCASQHTASTLVEDVDDDNNDDNNNKNYDDFCGSGGKDGGILAHCCVGGRTLNSNRSLSGYVIDVGNSHDAAA